MKQYFHKHEVLGKNLTTRIEKLESLTGDNTFQDKVTALLCELMHCRSLEPYPSTPDPNVLVTSSEGKINSGYVFPRFVNWMM